MKRLVILSLLLACVPLASAQAQVVVSIKPIHSLAASIMEGSGITPTLLVDGKQSLHDFALKPSQMQQLKHCELLFYIGESFESFLHPLLPQLPDGCARVAIATEPELTLWPRRNSLPEHSHEHGHEHKTDSAQDLHLWMSIDNARIIAATIATHLSQHYPKQATLFASNAQKLDQRLATLDGELKRRMTPLRNSSFAVFHDGIQYFDRRYGLRHTSSLVWHHDQPLAPKKLQQLRRDILSGNLRCIFTDPESSPEMIQKLREGSNAQTATLDPEGMLLPAGSELYITMMEQTAKAMENCLSPRPHPSKP